jgi:integrase-like protein
MDGKGRYMDNIFVERLWRSLKYEEVYLNAYASVAEAKAGIGSWLHFYNVERQHQSLSYRAPRQVYEAECRCICGRSASPTERAFAHIPTGTTTDHRVDVDKEEHKKRCHDRRDERDRSRHGNRPGYTLEDGSGCLTIGVNLRHRPRP